MSASGRSAPASAAIREDARGVEVRDGCGRLLCRASAEQAEVAWRAGIGRLVAGGRVLRVRDLPFEEIRQVFHWQPRSSDYATVMQAQRNRLF